MNFDFRESCLEVDLGIRTKLTGDKNGDVRIKRLSSNILWFEIISIIVMKSKSIGF